MQNTSGRPASITLEEMAVMVEYFRSKFHQPPPEEQAAIDSFHDADCVDCGNTIRLPHYPNVDQIVMCPHCGSRQYIEGHDAEEPTELEYVMDEVVT